MKKLLIIAGASLVLFGCSVPFLKPTVKSIPTSTTESTKTTTQGKTTPSPSKSNDDALFTLDKDNLASGEGMIDINKFYFNANSSGLVLKYLDDDKFEQRLSEKPIQSAEIQDGILVFTELDESGGQSVKTINLSAFTDFINQENTKEQK